MVVFEDREPNLVKGNTNSCNTDSRMQILQFIIVSIEPAACLRLNISLVAAVNSNSDFDDRKIDKWVLRTTRMVFFEDRELKSAKRV
ncbi:hypothetical protein DPMN_052830 [Dreissena polymorpha]|uniref:Uncharacterized protein n=1 Tax=Dreissena polymorpha TaxID=45954 RepID=A0A9D4CMH8_DREPO|nr:hypothetical protein DPMN_052830 [Dreissena polymorpha]